MGPVAGIGRYLARGASWSVFARIAATGLSFLVSILLARLLGVAEYGVYQYALGWIALLGVATDFGLGKVVTREAAGGAVSGAWGRVRGAIRFGYAVALVTSLAMFAIVALSSRWMSGEFAAVMLVAAFLLPVQAVLRITNAVQTGFKEIVRASLPDLFRSALLLAVLAWLLYGVSLEFAAERAVSIALGCTVAASLLALLLLLGTLRRAGPSLNRARPSYRAAGWLKAGLPLMLIAGMMTVNNQADILMIGALRGNEDVGLYHAASRIANFLTFALGAMIVPLSPLIAEFHASGDKTRLQDTVTRTTRLVFILTVPLGVAFIAYGSVLLGVLYGEPFSKGGNALALLSVAQMVNVFAGPVQALLVMCSQERAAAWGIALSTMTNVGLNGALIPYYGIEGAAIATGLSVVVWNVLLIRECNRRLGIRPTALSWLAQDRTDR